MNISPTSIPGCFELHPRVIHDSRGHFVKTFQRDVFQQFGISIDFAEEFYTVSTQRILRGLHFQTPPFELSKLVYCVEGEILDAIVDLRLGSPTFGQHALFRLTSRQANMLFIRPGIAHGYYVTSPRAIVMYKVTANYSPEHDTGILWNSVPISWPDKTPVLSKRDQGFLPFSAFDTPFVFKASS